jgi:hypothetical protein
LVNDFDPCFAVVVIHFPEFESTLFS